MRAEDVGPEASAAGDTKLLSMVAHCQRFLAKIFGPEDVPIAQAYLHLLHLSYLSGKSTGKAVNWGYANTATQTSIPD